MNYFSSRTTVLWRRLYWKVCPLLQSPSNYVLHAPEPSHPFVHSRVQTVNISFYIFHFFLSYFLRFRMLRALIYNFRFWRWATIRDLTSPFTLSYWKWRLGVGQLQCCSTTSSEKKCVSFDTRLKHHCIYSQQNDPDLSRRLTIIKYLANRRFMLIGNTDQLVFAWNKG